MLEAGEVSVEPGECADDQAVSDAEMSTAEDTDSHEKDEGENEDVGSL